MKPQPPKPPSVKKRLLTPEEKAVWKRHTRDDEKLYIQEEQDEPELAIESGVIHYSPPPVRISEKPLQSMIVPKKPPQKPLEKSVTANIDRRTAQRFQKGKLSIDARLDLHGHGRESAYMHLLAFIHRGYQAGYRCVLIITGRGLFQKDRPIQERGVLRGALKNWLNDPAIRPFILAFEQAQIKDGGEGAFYVLLKRKRS